MTVHELKALLAALPEDATVVVEDPDGQPQPAVRALRHAEVRRISITHREGNGVGYIEVDGPHIAVLLGTL